MFNTAVGPIGVYICYDRHFPEGWRELGLNGAQIVFNPNATKPGLSNRLWEIEQPAAAAANGYFVAAANRVGLEDNEYGDLAVNFYGKSQFVDPQGNIVGDYGSETHEEVVVRDLDMDMIRAGAQRVAVLPRPPPRVLHLHPEAVARRATRRSTMTTTLITGGTVVSATGRAAADVLVDGETIQAVLAPGSTLLGTDVAASVDRVIDATGKYVIPGGIDAHTHMQLPFGGTEASDTFETGTRAAAWGGTTSIIDFAVQTYGQRIEDGLAAWHEKAAGNCAIDYGFHQIVGDVNDASLEAMRRLPDEGISSFKLFMAYPGVFYSDDAQILKAMQVSRDTGMLTMMHAENGPAIDVLAQQLVDQGKTDPYYHGIARAWEMEEEATHRAIMLAKLTGAPLYVVHVSAKQAVEQLAWARDKGQNVYGETCPQYLYLSLEEQLGASSEQWGALRGRQVGVLDAAALARGGPPARRCGRRCARTTCRWSRPTTARSA